MKRPEKKREAVHFHDLIIDYSKQAADCDNTMQKRSIRDMFEQEVYAASKGGDDLAMSLGQSSIMVFGNKFKNPKKSTDNQKQVSDIGLLNSNGIDCNTESSRSIGLIGSGAYHQYKGEIADANSLRFGAFSAFSALRASPLKESQQESRNGSNDIRSPQNAHAARDGIKSIDNSMCSGNGAKLQHEVFFEKQQSAMRQLMQGLLSQPQKSGEKQALQRVNETSRELSTGQSYEDRVQKNKRPDNENCSPNLDQSQWPQKEDANLKIEELSNSKISFRDEPQFRQRESRWHQDQSKSTYSMNSQSIIPEENFQSLQGLMSEKERANLEIEKIQRNKSLTPLDKQKAIRSVKSLTRTIDDLIYREKDKISDHFESQLFSQINFGNQQMPTKTDLGCSDLFGLDKSNELRTSAQESGSFLVDQSSEQETKEMEEHELEQRPLKRNGTNDWKMQVTPLAQKLAFGVQSTGMRLEDVNTSLLDPINSIASSQAENGNPLKRSQILTKTKQSSNLAQTLPTSNYNTQKAPQRHFQGRQSEYCTLQTNNDKNRKKGNFWQEAIAETELEDESLSQTASNNLHFSSLMNNKNNSIADIIMTTPSFDPGSKVSAAFLENSIADNSGIQLKNFSLGAVTIGNESADMMLSPSQQSQPQLFLKQDRIKPATENRPTQLEQQLIAQLQDYVLKYQNVLQELDILLQNQEQLKQTNNQQVSQISALEGHLKQADDIRVGLQVKEADLMQQNIKLTTENQLLKQQQAHNEMMNQTKQISFEAVQVDQLQQQRRIEEITFHFQAQIEAQTQMLQDYSHQVEIYKMAQAQSEQMLAHLENESQHRLNQQEAGNLELQNKVKYLEDELIKNRAQASSQSFAKAQIKADVQKKIQSLEQECSDAADREQQLKSELARAQQEIERMSDRLDTALHMTQKERVQQTVNQMDLDSYITQIQRLKRSEEQLKAKLKKQTDTQSSQHKDAAETNAKYAVELEKNRALESQVNEFKEQLAQAVTESSSLQQAFKACKSQVKAARDKEIEQSEQLHSLKESLRIKMSVADDLQVILNQSRAQNEDYRRHQKEAVQERDSLMSQLWACQRDSKDLSARNEVLVHELESIISDSQLQDCIKNPFLTRLKSVLSETKCGLTRKRELHSSIGTEDPELERAMNFQTISGEEGDQMVPERERQTESNEDYFNQWVSSFK